MKVEKKGTLYTAKVLSDEEEVLYVTPNPMTLKEIYQEVWKRGFDIHAGIKVEHKGSLYTAKVMSNEQKILYVTPNPMTLGDVYNALLERGYDIRAIYDAFHEMDPDWEKHNPEFFRTKWEP